GSVWGVRWSPLQPRLCQSWSWQRRPDAKVATPQGLHPMVLGPALILGLKDAAGVVAKGDEGSQPLAQQSGAVGTEGLVAMRDRNALSVLDLEDGLVGVDEETALGNMRFEGRQGDRGTLGFVYGRRQCRRVCARKNPFGEPSYCFLELHGEVAVRGE